MTGGQGRGPSPGGRVLGAVVLGMEGLVVLFATLVAADLSDVDPTTVWTLGGGLAVGCVLAAGLLRRPWGVWLGWLLQVAVLAGGLVVPAMFALGAVFAALWAVALYLGRRVEQFSRENADDRVGGGR